MSLQILYQSTKLLFKTHFLPPKLEPETKAAPPEKVRDFERFPGKALKVLEYGKGYVDGLNPFTPLLEEIPKRLNLEQAFEHSSEYQTGKMHGSATGLVLDAYLTKTGGTALGASIVCEASSVGICTPVAGAGAVAGAATGASGILMSAGHGRNLVESQNKINTESSSKAESPKITEADIKDKTRTEIRELAKEKGLKEFGQPDLKDGLPKKWKDPVTNKERLRLDRGHVDENGKPYDKPSAAIDHAHAREPNGKNYIKDALTNDHHFPTKGE